MEEPQLPLLATNESLSSSSSLSKSRWEVVTREIKKVSYIAMPMVVTSVSQNSLAMINIMMIGHLGELALSGAAIATSLANVTGFSLMVGMSGALETLCGQAYGAQQYQMIGTYTYAAIISLFFVCIPVSILWCFTEKFLTVIGQDPLISHEAGIYTKWLIPAIFPYAILQLLVRFLLTQSLLYPMLLSSVAALIFHIPVTWMLIFKFKFGSAGAALGIGLACWLNVILLGIYVKYTSSCEKTRISFSKNVFPCIREFFRFGIPSAVMLCLEWWSYELAILLSGRLPNPQLETSVMSICLVVSSLHFNIPNSFAAGASSRVSNELGAGHPEAARLAAWVSTFLAVIEVVIASTILFSCRSILGYAFGGEKEIVDYVKEMIPLISLSIMGDCLATLFSGVARGVGWQRLGAYVNLGAYYLCGIPMACVLAFVLNWRGKGLWIGLITATLLQSCILMLITFFTDWKKQLAAIATSLTNVTGFSLLLGMASALETLCGQAYGAKQYQLMGSYTYGAIISLLLVCIPISILWIFTEKLLVMIGQDPLISHQAGIYSICLIPTLFPYAILQLLVRYLLTQRLLYPMLLSSVAALVFHIPVTWMLIFKFKFGSAGAALGISLSYWLNVILLGIYVKYASSCENTRISFSKDVFPSIREFFRFGIPSAVMICLQWWSYELVILLSGLLPNPQLETSVLTICFMVVSLHYYIPYSFSTGASTRVSNELGAGHAEAARLAAWVATFLAAIEAVIASTILFSCRSILGYAFGDEKELADYIKEMTPFLCFTIMTDCLANMCSGVARGVGWQRLAAYVNLGAFYLCGIPVACVLAFVFHWRGKGLWIGLATASFLQSCTLMMITFFTDWKKQARNTWKRIFEGRSQLSTIE